MSEFVRIIVSHVSNIIMRSCLIFREFLNLNSVLSSYAFKLVSFALITFFLYSFNVSAVNIRGNSISDCNSHHKTIEKENIESLNISNGEVNWKQGKQHYCISFKSIETDHDDSNSFWKGFLIGFAIVFFCSFLLFEYITKENKDEK
jgi:hypothetical protein